MPPETPYSSLPAVPVTPVAPILMRVWRVTESTSLAYPKLPVTWTTPAMPRLSVPPICSTGSWSPMSTWAIPTDCCVQSSTRPVATEVRFILNTRLVTDIENVLGSRPWMVARPSDASSAVNFLTGIAL